MSIGVSTVLRGVPRKGRATLALLACAALSGCGVSGGGDAALGYPTVNPTLLHRALTPTLEDHRVLLTVPRGWRVAQLDQPKTDLSLVRLTGACYLSISVTGSSTQRIDAAGVAARYSRAANGYRWVVTTFGGAYVAVLSQYATRARPASRSTLATAYLRVGAGRYLVLDIGAGIWPLHHHTCSTSAFASHIGELQANIDSVFGNARLRPAGSAT